MECKNKVNKVLNTTFKTAKAAASFPTAFGQLLLFYYEKEWRSSELKNKTKLWILLFFSNIGLFL